MPSRSPNDAADVPIANTGIRYFEGRTSRRAMARSAANMSRYAGGIPLSVILEL